MKSKQKALVGALVSVIALTVTLWNVSFRELGAALAAADLKWLAPALVATFALYGLRAFRWAVLIGRVPFGTTYHALNIGYMLNIMLPFKVGEIARCYAIAKRTDVPMARALSSVFVERLTDLGAVVLLFAVFAQLVPMPPTFTRAAAIASAAVVGGVVFGFALVIKGEAAERLMRPYLLRISEKSADRWLARFRDLCDGFRAVGSIKRLAASLVLAGGVWALTVAVTYFTLRAFIPATATQAGLVVVMANLGGAVPSAPGGLGIIQMFAKNALVIPFGVDQGRATAFAFVWSLGQQLVLILLGMVGLARLGLRFSEARESAEAAQPAAAPPPAVKAE